MKRLGLRMQKSILRITWNSTNIRIYLNIKIQTPGKTGGLVFSCCQEYFKNFPSCILEAMLLRA